jgi:hypothetical protein
MRSLAIWPSLPWILRFAQDDKPSFENTPMGFVDGETYDVPSG